MEIGGFAHADGLPSYAMEITVCRAADVDVLDRCIGSPGATSFHARRFERQERGSSTSLVAWHGRRPVGHTEVRWGGCDDVTVRAVWPGPATGPSPRTSAAGRSRTTRASRANVSKT